MVIAHIIILIKLVPAIFSFSLFSVINAYDISLKASKEKEHELLEKLNAAEHDLQEKDHKCSKLEDDMYDMQKKMACIKDDYEQQQELLVKLQQMCKYISYIYL